MAQNGKKALNLSTTIGRAGLWLERGTMAPLQLRVMGGFAAVLPTGQQRSDTARDSQPHLATWPPGQITSLGNRRWIAPWFAGLAPVFISPSHGTVRD